jgi:hypothetical protein
MSIAPKYLPAENSGTGCHSRAIARIQMRNRSRPPLHRRRSKSLVYNHL